MASVAVIGGGISGLTCAIRLTQLGIRNVTVFDTGKHITGGRCSSRDLVVQSQVMTFDHSCQYFTVSSPQFAKVTSYLLRCGAVRKSEATFGHVDKSGKFTADKKTCPVFVGTDGIRSIAKCLSKDIDVKFPVWVNEVQWNAVTRKWKVDKFGYYDYLVVAHNGKCADKLMANAGAPDIHRLLQVRFSPTLNPRDQRMHLCSIFVLLISLTRPLKLPYTGAHVSHEHLSWICNNTEKSGPESGAKQKPATEAWTIMSSREFGSQYKVPQNYMPPKVEKEVTDRLLTAFCEVTGKSRSSLQVNFSYVQLWGAAVPLNVLDAPDKCLFDTRRNVGVCGDWCVSPCIEGAAVSGIALAEHIHKHTQGEGKSTSLVPRFKPAQSSVIGAFPQNPDLNWSS